MQDKEKLASFLREVMKTGIRARQRRVRKFDKNSLKTIVLSLQGGVLGVTGCLIGEPNRKIQTVIFNKLPNSFGMRVWSLKKAKNWLSQYKSGIRKIINPERVLNKLYVTKMVEDMENELKARLPRVITNVLKEV